MPGRFFLESAGGLLRDGQQLLLVVTDVTELQHLGCFRAPFASVPKKCGDSAWNSIIFQLQLLGNLLNELGTAFGTAAS